MTTETATLQQLVTGYRRWTRGWAGKLAVGYGLATAVYLLAILLLPSEGWRFEAVSDAALVPLSFGAFLLSWLASRDPSHDRRTRRAWQLYALAYLAFTIGNGIWFVLEAVYRIPPYPSLADTAFLSFYPLMLGALLSFADELRSRQEKIKFALDSGIVMVAGGLFVWHFLLEPLLKVERPSALGTAIALAYPISDLVLLFGITSLIMRPTSQRRIGLFGFLLADMLLFLGADTVFVYENAAGTYQSGTLADALYAVAWYVALVGGSWQVLNGSRTSEAKAPAKPYFSLLPYLAVVLVYGLLLCAEHTSREILVYSSIVVTLVVVRQVVALRAVLRAQEALRESDERFRLVTRATSDAVWDWDLLTGNVWWSDGVESLFGYAPAEASCNSDWWVARIHPDDRERVERCVRNALEHGDATLAFEYRFRCASGSYATVSDRGFIVRGEEGAPVRMVGSMMDISERVRAQETVEEARDAALQSAKLKSQFLANMSHEIRTPMNGVIGLTDVVLGTELTPDQRQYLGMVKQSANSLLGIINDILDFSKIEAGKIALERAPFRLSQMLHDTLAPLALRAEEKGLRLTHHVAAGVPDELTGDATRVQQVVTNLVGNAIKFTNEGEVTVTVSADWSRGEEIGLRFAVADTGVGIAPDKQRLIFEAFTQADSSATRRQGGTGLGLAICSQLVALMGGRIWVESDTGLGSTFFFTTTLGLSGERVHVENVGHVSDEHRQPLKVLVAEDNRVNQLVATKLLAKHGHTVTVVENGRLAVDAIARDRFDLILMDVQMPHMDGLEATAHIRERERFTGRHIPIIALTAHAMKGDEERCLAAGMDGYVPKPIHAETLLRAMERAGVWSVVSSQ